MEMVLGGVTELGVLGEVGQGHDGGGGHGLLRHVVVAVVIR